MSKIDNKRDKIKKIACGYYKMEIICTRITEELNKALITLLNPDAKKDEKSESSLLDKLFVDYVIGVSKDDDLCILGIIRFGARRIINNVFKHKDTITEEIKIEVENINDQISYGVEQEIFATYIVNPIGYIKGQSGIDDEWFFDFDEKPDVKLKIEEIAIGALDFMLLKALSWVNKG